MSSKEVPKPMKCEAEAAHPTDWRVEEAARRVPVPSEAAWSEALLARESVQRSTVCGPFLTTNGEAAVEIPRERR